FAQLCEPFNMGLIDDGVLPRDCRSALLTPGKCLVHHDRLRHPARIVAAIERQVASRASCAITEMSVAPHDPACKLFGIRVDQKLVSVEPVSEFGLVGSMNAIAVKL